MRVLNPRFKNNKFQKYVWYTSNKTSIYHLKFYKERFLQMRIALAPFFYVTFADFWVADQLNSLVSCFTDIQFMICFYYTSTDWDKVTGGKKNLDYNEYYLILKTFFYRSKLLYRKLLSYKSRNAGTTGLVPFCSMPTKVQGYKRSKPSPRECTQVFHIVSSRHFLHVEYYVLRYATCLN